MTDLEILCRIDEQLVQLKRKYGQSKSHVHIFTTINEASIKLHQARKLILQLQPDPRQADLFPETRDVMITRDRPQCPNGHAIGEDKECELCKELGFV